MTRTDDEGGPVDDVESPAARDPRLLIVLGVLAAVSAVVAGFVIFSDGPKEAAKPDAVAAVRAGATSLSMGPTKAPAQVRVVADFADASSRSFDIASRDFLEIAAARGGVVVDYQPFTARPAGYGAEALGAWGLVLAEGTPRQALRFQRELFDRQPGADETTREFIDLARGAGVTDPDVLADLGDAGADPALVAAGATARRTAGASSVGGAADGPVVTLDGQRLAAATPVALADALQRALAKEA